MDAEYRIEKKGARQRERRVHGSRPIADSNKKEDRSQ
jgi:hypothetical protein